MVASAVLSRRFDRLFSQYYHGTTARQYASLKAGVDVNRCKPHTDFGQGFYLTSNFTQASKHAERRCFKDQTPIVFIYDIHLTALKKFNGQVWFTMNKPWADFIYRNRSMRNHLPHKYDYVLGGVADGQLDDLIDMMDSGSMSIDVFYESIAKYAAYDQLSVHNQMIFDHHIID